MLGECLPPGVALLGSGGRRGRVCRVACGHRGRGGWDSKGRDEPWVNPRFGFAFCCGGCVAFLDEMREGLDADDYNKAADEMVDSEWYKQVKSRGPRTVDLMRSAVK